jgi:hypothetical protein
MERGEYRQQGGDMQRDLEEKESSVRSFGPTSPRKAEDEAPQEGHSPGGTMGDSRPDEVGPGEAHFVDATDDPNMQIARRTSELTEPQREGAEELDARRQDDSTVVARPQRPLMEEGAELRPRREGGEQS